MIQIDDNPARVCERTGQADDDAAEQTRGSAAAIALEALDQLRPREDSPLLFSNTRGGHLDSATSTGATGSPSREQLGSSRCATSTTRATPTPPSRSAPASRCSHSRFMGTSIAMIDLHYGHLAVDSYQHAVSLLGARARTGGGRCVDIEPEARKLTQLHGF